MYKGKLLFSVSFHMLSKRNTNLCSVIKRTHKGVLHLFYETLAKYYDEIFPYEPGKVTFLDREFKAMQAKRILDLACGIGTYTNALAKLGYTAWGTDLELNMVENAKQKARESGSSARFEVGDMRNPDSLGLEFDGLFCIGNSLAHLSNREDIQQTLTNMHGVLRSGGITIIQIVNFDRILALGDTELPLIERENLRFLRVYRPQSDGRILFDSVIELKQEDNRILRLENRVELRAIRQSELQADLLGAGFTETRTYGDFNYGEYNERSGATIMIAK